jgi:hypothetical protein
MACHDKADVGQERVYARCLDLRFKMMMFGPKAETTRAGAAGA